MLGSPLPPLVRSSAAGAPAARRLQARKRRPQRIDGGYRYLQLDRMAYYVHKDSYRKAVLGHTRELRAALPATLPDHASQTDTTAGGTP